MSTLFIYTIFLLGHLSVYFYFKNNLSLSSNVLEYNNKSNPQLTIVETNHSQKVTNSIANNKKMLLQKNLRQLEFINEFEMYLDEKSLNNFSIEFLQEFEQIKIEAQLSTLKATSQLNNVVKMAA
ncbi:hypothetical protein [Winogradskyella eximia]|uniref:hypothetical protein n=1 Tax=Winogradskyella eximia TaxID=262006 RepID=UPI00248FE08B|nr:hypothetical protein [Winogradskyella eximia]